MYYLSSSEAPVSVRNIYYMQSLQLGTPVEHYVVPLESDRRAYVEISRHVQENGTINVPSISAGKTSPILGSGYEKKIATATEGPKTGQHSSTELEGVLHGTQKQLAVLQKEKAEKEAALEALKQDFALLKREIDRLRSTVQSKADDPSRSAEGLKGRIAELESCVSQMDRESRNLVSVIGEQNAQLEELRRSKGVYDPKVLTASRDLEDAKRKAAAQADRVAALENQLSAVKSEQNSAKSLEDENAKLRELVGTLQGGNVQMGLGFPQSSQFPRGQHNVPLFGVTGKSGGSSGSPAFKGINFEQLDQSQQRALFETLLTNMEERDSQVRQLEAVVDEKEKQLIRVTKDGRFGSALTGSPNASGVAAAVGAGNGVSGENSAEWERLQREGCDVAGGIAGGIAGDGGAAFAEANQAAVVSGEGAGAATRKTKKRTSKDKRGTSGKGVKASSKRTAGFGSAKGSEALIGASGTSSAGQRIINLSSKAFQRLDQKLRTLPGSSKDLARDRKAAAEAAGEGLEDGEEFARPQVIPMPHVGGAGEGTVEAVEIFETLVPSSSIRKLPEFPTGEGVEGAVGGSAPMETIVMSEVPLVPELTRFYDAAKSVSPNKKFHIVKCMDLGAELSEQSCDGLPVLVVDRIIRDGPAYHAGIEEGDILRAWNSVLLESIEILLKLLAHKSSTKAVMLNVLRAGRRLTIPLVRGATPSNRWSLAGVERIPRKVTAKAAIAKLSPNAQRRGGPATGGSSSSPHRPLTRDILKFENTPSFFDEKVIKPKIAWPI